VKYLKSGRVQYTMLLCKSTAINQFSHSGEPSAIAAAHGEPNCVGAALGCYWWWY